METAREAARQRYSEFMADLDARCPASRSQDGSIITALCETCGAPLMGRGEEISRLNDLVGEIRTVDLCQRLIDRLDELTSWERPAGTRCYVCASLFQFVGKSKYWQGVESARQAELARRKRLLES
jgi:hypothetical protein